MPKAPQGRKRPADVIGNAVKAMRIAIGEEEEAASVRSAAAELGSSRRQADLNPRLLDGPVLG